MNFEEDYLSLLDMLKENSTARIIKDSEIITLLDLTLLDIAASEENLTLLERKANQHQVAAICVLPEHLHLINPSIGVNLATVVNFPDGQQDTKNILLAIEQLVLKEKIDEIDYVFPYQAYLEGKKDFALTQCQQVFQLCHQLGIHLKVILETGAFPSLDSIYQASTAIIKQGCDFIKTSTGKISVGATLSAAFAMLKAIKDSHTSCGIKISGGIRNRDQALQYIKLAEFMCEKNTDKHWFRIGASTLLDELVATYTTAYLG